MEIYILDALLRPIDVVDQFISMIWTERFAAKGDFQLVTLSTPANRKRFVYDTMIMIPDSKRIMRVYSIDESIDSEKGAILTIEGYDLVSILEQRVITTREDGGSHDGMLNSVVYFNGWAPLNLINTMVWGQCVPTSGWMIQPGDEIPFLNDYLLNPGSLYPPTNLPIPYPEGIRWEQKIATLYSAVVDVANAYDLGFRMYKDPNATKLYFESYLGVDRTTAQTTYPPVVFSSDMSNLQNTKEYQDNVSHFNVVIALYEYKNEEPGGYPSTLTMSQTVSDPQLAFTSGGFEQKTKHLLISQLPDHMDLEDVPAYLQQLAQEELTRSRPINVFDGEIDQTSDFVYERDYYLGDIVEVRGDNGAMAYMRVEEQIIKEDQSGKSSYPSLVSKVSIGSGTWRSWKYDVNWVDMGSGEYWNNQ